MFWALLKRSSRFRISTAARKAMDSSLDLSADSSDSRMASFISRFDDWRLHPVSILRDARVVPHKISKRSRERYDDGLRRGGLACCGGRNVLAGAWFESNFRSSERIV